MFTTFSQRYAKDQIGENQPVTNRACSSFGGWWNLGAGIFALLISVSNHLSFRAVLIYHSCHSPCLTLSIIIKSDPVQSPQMFSALTPTNRCSILFIRLYRSKSRITDVQIYQMFNV